MGWGHTTSPKSYQQCPLGQLFPGVPSGVRESKAIVPSPGSQSQIETMPRNFCLGRERAGPTCVGAHAQSGSHSPLPHQGDVDAVGSCHRGEGHKSADQGGQVLGEGRYHLVALRAMG